MRIFYEITPAFEAQDIPLIPVFQGGDILSVLLGQVFLTHGKHLPNDMPKNGSILLGHVNKIYPGTFHKVSHDGEEPREWSEKFLCAKKIISSIYRSIRAGELNTLAQKEETTIKKLNIVLSSEHSHDLEKEFWRTFVNHVEFLTRRFRKEDVFNWIKEYQILQWLKAKDIQVDETVISHIAPPIENYQNQAQPTNSREPEDQGTTQYRNEEVCDEPERKALIFLRRADFWEIGIQETKHFRHKKGLTYFHFLLSHPRKNYSCHELQQIELGYEVSAKRHFEKDPEYIAPLPEKIEENAKILKKEIAEILKELEEAKENNSPDVDLLEKEFNKFAKLYKQLYDKEGRPRNVGSQDEKVRKAVGKALKDAKNAILKELPDLEPILKNVTSGKKLGYFPDDNQIEILTSPS